MREKGSLRTHGSLITHPISRPGDSKSQTTIRFASRFTNFSTNSTLCENINKIPARIVGELRRAASR
jgi:hypothetical protein